MAKRPESLAVLWAKTAIVLVWWIAWFVTWRTHPTGDLHTVALVMWVLSSPVLLAIPLLFALSFVRALK